MSKYKIPGQRNKEVSPLDILQQRFASGQITKEEYQEHKSILIDDIGKKESLQNFKYRRSMKETSISQTKSENIKKADEKDYSLQVLTDQILPKRIRKRIKYTRKAVAEKPAIITVPQSDQKSF